MRKEYSTRLTAGFTLFSAALGMLIALTGLIALWVTRDTVTQQVNAMVDLGSRTLDATSRTITVTRRTLEQASGDLDSIHTMIGDLGVTLKDSGSLIASTSDLMGTSMVGMVNDTRTQLSSVEKSAGLVDDFLGLLSAVPFIGGRYKPDVPLKESVARVSTSLDPLPQAFGKISRDLDVASANAETLKKEVDLLGGQVEDIQTSITSAKEVTADYEAILSDARLKFDKFEARIGRWMNVFYASLTIFLVWLLISQVGALLQGVALMRSRD